MKEIEMDETTETPMPDEEIVARVRAWMVKEGLVGDDTPADAVQRVLSARYPDQRFSGEIELTLPVEQPGSIRAVTTYHEQIGLPPDIRDAIANVEHDADVRWALGADQ